MKFLRILWQKTLTTPEKWELVHYLKTEYQASARTVSRRFRNNISLLQRLDELPCFTAGLTLPCFNQQGAGRGFLVNIFRQRELQNADEDDFGKVLHNLLVRRILRFPFSQVQLSMRKYAEALQKSTQILRHR